MLEGNEGTLFLYDIFCLPLGVVARPWLSFLDDIKADGDGVPTVTDAQANALMDLVIAKNIFASANGSLIGKKDAKIITTDTSTVELA